MLGWLKFRFGKSTPEQPRSPAALMMRLQRADVYYLHIAKSGSTYLKNLFYYLDHAAPHPDGDSIHGTQDLRRADANETDRIRQSSYAFAVIRNPVSRFMSLYFDKIYGDGPLNFPDMQLYFTQNIGLDLSRDLDATGHRRNAHLLIDWIGESLAGNTDQPVNFHWRRQSRRLKRVETLDLRLLTLDGLDWQLPLLLQDVLPDIRDAMAAVRSRNTSHAPIAPKAVLDDDLRMKIETVYAADKRIYDKTRRHWEPWTERESVANGKIRCFTAKNHPVNAIAVPKVGRTFVRNLMYLLENGEAYGDPLGIHVDGVVSKADQTREDLAREVSFFVVRNPVDRFFSMYFDKVYGSGLNAFPWIADRLVNNRGFLTDRGLTLEQHRENCHAFLSYLDLQLKNHDMSAVNPHWRPQIETATKAIAFGMKPLMLEDLERQLLQISDGRISGLEAAFKAAPEKNCSEKPYSAAEILTPGIARRISALYGADQALYERVKFGWDKNGTPPEL